MARAAGDYPRVRDQANVAALMHNASSGEQYGPSHAALERWKRTGIPTAEIPPTASAFGMSTRKGDTAADAIAGVAAPAPPLPNYARPAAGRRANPITWEGGDDRMPASAAPAPASTRLPPPITLDQVQESWTQHKPQPSPQLSPAEMQQTWSQLMRSGRASQAQSAAQCLIEMPPAYSLEAQPRQPEVSSQSLLTIGLHPQNGGRDVRRSTKFTSDFRDPFL